MFKTKVLEYKVVSRSQTAFFVQGVIAYSISARTFRAGTYTASDNAEKVWALILQAITPCGKKRSGYARVSTV